MRAFAPITSGPRSRERSTTVPGPSLTGPSITEASSTSPAMRVSRSASTMRFASSRSSTRPVSFHQPWMTCERTFRPVVMRCWIASVISSSPRGEGLIARTASKMDAVKR